MENTKLPFETFSQSLSNGFDTAEFKQLVIDAQRKEIAKMKKTNNVFMWLLIAQSIVLLAITITHSQN